MTFSEIARNFVTWRQRHLQEGISSDRIDAMYCGLPHAKSPFGGLLGPAQTLQK